jgi:hypothetical protein
VNTDSDAIVNTFCHLIGMVFTMVESVFMMSECDEELGTLVNRW